MGEEQPDPPAGQEQELDIDYDSDAVSEPDESGFGRTKPVKKEDFESCIIVDGIPVVDRAKEPKLKKLLGKLYSQVGKVVDMSMPFEGAKSLGFMFVEFETTDEAQEAVAKTNNYKLDKKHTFKVDLCSKIDEYLSVSDTFEVPAKPEYVEGENLREWLLDSKARQQYVARYMDRTDIYWNDHTTPEPVLEHGRSDWSNSFVAWSSMGSYLATAHDAGICIQGGKSFSPIVRLEHPDVHLIHFSPSEKFVVTFSGDQKEQLIVWELPSGKKMRSFSGLEPESFKSWPYFKWSHDDAYFGRVAEDVLYMYETATFKHIVNQKGKMKGISVPGIVDMEWSPTENVVAYWYPEQDGKPARAVVTSIPSLNEVRQKNLFNVATCMLHWHPDGKFLAVKVDRLTKTKKPSHTDFEIFCLKAKDVPVETCMIKEPVTAFAWEPQGNRFSISAGAMATQQEVSIYKIKDPLTKPSLDRVGHETERSINSFYWSPQGKIVVMAALGKGGMDNGLLEFWNADTMEMMGEGEHYMASEVAWDPAGRFLATSVSQWSHQFENGFRIWSFSGKLVHQKTVDKFFQILWRPTPPTCLTKEQIADTKKNLKKWVVAFEEEDKQIREAQANKNDAESQKIREDFLALVAQRYEEWRAEAEERRQVRGGSNSDDEGEFDEVVETEDIIVEETIEELE